MHLQFILMITYIKSFLHRSSQDIKNDKHLSIEDYAEDIYGKIEDLMTKESFVKLLQITRDITDKPGRKEYGSSPGASCNASTIFKPTIQNLLLDWDKSNKMLIELEEWQTTNERRTPSELCNRFNGLTCQLGGGASSHGATCQCEGDPNEVGFFSPADFKQAREQPLQDHSYTEGCYIKPWRPCSQLLSQDHTRRIIGNFPKSISIFSKLYILG